MKKFSVIFLVLALWVTVCWAGDPPSGYMPMSKLAEAQAKARQSKKLIAVTAKGYDDNCPYCADAMSKGTSALKSDCVMVFIRVADLRKERPTLPEALRKASADAWDGAAVAFYVFDPDFQELVATFDRGSLEKDPKSLRDVKKKVDDAQKKFAAVPTTKN